MQRFMDILSRVLASISLLMLVLGIGLLPPNIASAQTGGGCTNGGGGATTCAANAAGDGCSAATSGQQCDSNNLACTCIPGSIQVPCQCAGG
jgi:hypothetical protein